MIVAQIYLPVCQWCAESGVGSWEWWLRGCWMFDCPPEGGVIAGVVIASVVGVQLWARSRQPKA